MNNYKYIDAWKKDHYGKVVLWVPKEEKAEWVEAAKKEGVSLTEWIRRQLKGRG